MKTLLPRGILKDWVGPLEEPGTEDLGFLKTETCVYIIRVGIA